MTLPLRLLCTLLSGPRARGHAALALILGTALYAGIVGIDFGYHWDEPERVGTVIHAFERGELLPRWYHYPSVVHDLIVLSAAPALWHSVVGPASVGDGQAGLTEVLKSGAFLRSTRCIFFGLSMTGVIATYFFVLRYRERAFEAAVAAGLVGLSWEIGYHARWIAPDALTAALAATTLYALERAVTPRRSTAWLVGGALAAGLACGTKYPSGLLLLPVVLAAARAGRGRPSRALRYAGLCLAAFAFAYLVTTPGTLLQYRVFLADVQFEMQHYQTGHGGGHTVLPGIPHMLAELEYLSLVVLSPYAPIAGLFSALAVIGGVWLARRDRWRAAMLLAFPIVYVAYMGTQRVMMARNLLVIVPFLAVLSALGAGLCRDAMGRFSWGPPGVILVTLAMLFCNAEWLVTAGRSIEHPPDPLRELTAYLGERSSVPCRLSPRVRAAQARTALAPPVCTAEGSSRDPSWVAFYASEVRDKNRWVANRRDYTERTFGPREVNFNYYPSWLGSDRVVLMAREDARALGVIPGL